MKYSSFKYFATGIGLFFYTQQTIAQNNRNMTKDNSYAWPQNVKPPVADKKEKQLIAHGDTRLDPYYWMNDFFKKGPDSTRVVDYLKAENSYYETMTAGTNALQEKLYEEMKGRIKEKDESVPVFKNGYYYYSRVEPGKDYYVYCRKKGSLTAAEEVLLDVNKMAEGHNYFSAAGFSVSKDNKLLAYGIDILSRRQYNIYIKNIETGEVYRDVIANTEGNPVWANDNKTIFYTSKNLVTLLSEKINRHTLGTDAAADVTVYEEKDPSNYIGVSKTKSEEYIVISSSATLSSENWYLDAGKPQDAFKVFQPRMKEVLYYIDHANGQFYIQTNLEAKNFRIMTAVEGKTNVSDWKEMIAHHKDVLIENFELFKNFMVVSERKSGLTQVHVINLKNNESHYLAFDEPSYTASVANTPDYNSEVVRFNYTSLITPSSVYALLAERVADSKLPALSGSLCFWWHWFGKPNENPCTIISVSFNKSNDELRIKFSGNELLSVFEPEKISIENGQLIIYQATKIRIEWPDIGKDGHLKNRMFYEFQRIGKKITGNSNIH